MDKDEKSKCLFNGQCDMLDVVCSILILLRVAEITSSLH